MGIGNFEKDNSYKMVVGYLEKDIRGLNMKLGRWRKNITSESELSTGSLIRGKNAIPIPQVSLRLSDFKKTTFFNQDLWVKGGFSHGWFSKGGYVQAPFLHEKYVYFKTYFENQSSLTFGLVHEAMWGGETNKHGKQPQSFSDYLRVVFGRSGSGSAYEGEEDYAAEAAEEEVYDEEVEEEAEKEEAAEEAYGEGYEEEEKEPAGRQGLRNSH